MVYTENRENRAVILQRPDGLYTVELGTLYPFDEEELQYGVSDLSGYWRSGGIFDTPDCAEACIRSAPPYKYVVVNHFVYRLLGAYAIDIIGVACGDVVFNQARQLTPVLPGKASPVIVAKRIADCVVGNGVPIIGGQ